MTGRSSSDVTGAEDADVTGSLRGGGTITGSVSNRLSTPTRSVVRSSVFIGGVASGFPVTPAILPPEPSPGAQTETP